MENILFICSRNKDRSKTAEEFFAKKYPDKNFFSAGTNFKECDKIGSQKLEKNHLNLADKVYVMTEHHRYLINKATENIYDFKIKVLGIEDIYSNRKGALKSLAELRDLLDTIELD